MKSRSEQQRGCTNNCQLLQQDETGRIIPPGRWLRCHSQMFTSCMTWEGIKADSVARMWVSPAPSPSTLPCHLTELVTLSGLLCPGFQLGMPKSWLTACNRQSQAGLWAWDWPRGGSWRSGASPVPSPALCAGGSEVKMSGVEKAFGNSEFQREKEVSHV